MLKINKVYKICFHVMTIIMVFVFITFAEEKGKNNNKEYTERINETIYLKKAKKNKPKKTFYKQRKENKMRKQGNNNLEQDADVRSIHKSASEELNYILVLLSEMSLNNRRPIVAPVFMVDKDNIFGTGTDLSIDWVGYKITCRFQQKKFPWEDTTLQEYIIGSFLWASGTNLGFVGDRYTEEKRFYTNYLSQIVIIKVNHTQYVSTGYGLDSRQYFFIKRNTPDNFIMPKNHVNIFPRVQLDIGYIREKGIDRLTEGIKWNTWAGYGIRNRWEQWGEPGDLQSGKDAQRFLIFSTKLTAAYLFDNNLNIYFQGKYKDGINNDFLSRPRFGGTIDNARLDVVHGYSLEEFRVYRFALTNLYVSFDLIRRVRFSLAADYGHIFAPGNSNYIGSAYGFRILGPFGIPLWVTHGIGKRVDYHDSPVRQAITIMTAIGW